MSEEASEERSPDSPDSGPASPSSAPEDATASEEKKFLSYEGASVPRFLALLWMIFLIWGTVYLILYVPESMVEWFSRE